VRNPESSFIDILSTERSLGLPSRRTVKQRYGHDTGWASHYGGVDAVARYCKLTPSLPVMFDATWQHGVAETWRYTPNPLLLLCGKRHSEGRLILVANKQQKETLEIQGYNNVHAIGCPWIYAEPKRKPKRIAGSILLMPPHALDGAPFEDNNQINEYCTYASQRYRAKASLLIASIHLSCIRNGQWIQELSQAGISTIGGADHGDANSYTRMWHLFSLFETICTPNVGSHVFYALAAGCKVCIEGPRICYSDTQLMKDDSYRLLADEYGNRVHESEWVLQETAFAQLFSYPRYDQELGVEATGLNLKLDPFRLRKLLGWSKRKQLLSLTRNSDFVERFRRKFLKV